MHGCPATQMSIDFNALGPINTLGFNSERGVTTCRTKLVFQTTIPMAPKARAPQLTQAYGSSPCQPQQPHHNPPQMRHTFVDSCLQHGHAVLHIIGTYVPRQALHHVLAKAC